MISPSDFAKWFKPLNFKGAARVVVMRGQAVALNEKGEAYPMAKKIHLKGNWQTREVWLDGEKLNPGPSQKVWNHSPDGFNWGYGGSGPAQLALAILLALFPQKEYIAASYHQRFKFQFIVPLPQSDFDTTLDIAGFLSDMDIPGVASYYEDPAP